METILPNSDALRRLVETYYADRPNQSINEVTSSHWKYYGDMFKIKVDDNGIVISLRGAGFGRLKWPTFVHRILDELCVLVHFTHLDHADHIRNAWTLTRRICKCINISPTMDVFRYVCTVSLLQRHIPQLLNQGNLRFLMIGDGHGVLAALIKTFFPRAKMVMVDLGKTLLFQAYYCQKAHSTLDHVLIGQSGKIEDADFLYCPAERVGELAMLKFDVVVNIASMQEMNTEIVAIYFSLMRRQMNTTNLFYCCNRESKTLIGGEVLEFYKYPWREDDKHLVEGLCPWHQYFFAPMFAKRGMKILGVRVPFVNYYDGDTLHRLTVLTVD